MKSFTFYIDQKITMWTRSTKHIEAETYDQAVQILKKQNQAWEMFEDLDEYDYLHDTLEDLNIFEVYDSDDNIIDFDEIEPEEETVIGLS